MTVLVLGATGATGKLLVRELLKEGHQVRALVRNPAALDQVLDQDGDGSSPAGQLRSGLTVIRASVLEMPKEDLMEAVRGCDAVACCLGHNISFKGVFMPPRRLVTDAVERSCRTIAASGPDRPVKFVLMNTVGNGPGNEIISFREKILMSLLRLLVPPVSDNEAAARVLAKMGDGELGKKSPVIRWCAVRPDSLIDEDHVTEYRISPAVERSPLFNPGKTSRINVARFMADLITDASLFDKWEGKLPVIYNS